MRYDKWDTKRERGLRKGSGWLFSLFHPALPLLKGWGIDDIDDLADLEKELELELDDDPFGPSSNNSAAATAPAIQDTDLIDREKEELELGLDDDPFSQTLSFSSSSSDAAAAIMVVHETSKLADLEKELELELEEDPFAPTSTLAAACTNGAQSSNFAELEKELELELDDDPFTSSTESNSHLTLQQLPPSPISSTLTSSLNTSSESTSPPPPPSNQSRADVGGSDDYVYLEEIFAKLSAIRRSRNGLNRYR